MYLHMQITDEGSGTYSTWLTGHYLVIQSLQLYIAHHDLACKVTQIYIGCFLFLFTGEVQTTWKRCQSNEKAQEAMQLPQQNRLSLHCQKKRCCCSTFRGACNINLTPRVHKFGMDADIGCYHNHPPPPPPHTHAPLHLLHSLVHHTFLVKTFIIRE